jgi:hypothetical protein
MQELYSEFEKYCRSDNDYCKRLEEQNQGKQWSGRMGGGMVMDRASSSTSSNMTSKYSTLSTESPVSKASLPCSPEVRPQLTGSTKARAMTKEETGTRTRDKGSRSSTIFSWGRKRTCHQRLSRCQENPRKNQEQNGTAFAAKPNKGRKPHLHCAHTLAILPNLPKL